jgi:hypothetical protein
MSACSASSEAMGSDQIRYLLYLNGRWRWRPTATMRSHGFKLMSMGRGGPELDEDGNPACSVADKARAITLNSEWDKVRTGLKATPDIPDEFFPPGSVGEGYQRAMALRNAERVKNNVVWTKEHESRDDWPRAWKWLKPVFGDVDPKTVQPEHFLSIDERTGKATGLFAVIEAKVSITERHRVVKVWRALWKKMAGMGYCTLESDPSLPIANSAPDPRQATWQHHEVLKRVQSAWRMGFKGLAACLAVAWDSMLSPVDARTLSLSQLARDTSGSMFFLDRAKTGRAAAGTLTQWSLALLTAYIKHLKEQGIEIAPSSPIFRTPGAQPGPKGGRRWLPRPYSKNKLGHDFRIVRAAIDEEDDRQVADMRRSGAVEGMAGGVTKEDLSSKMANTIAASARLQKVYAPVNVVSVLRFDEARARGKALLREQKPDKSVTGG